MARTSHSTAHHDPHHLLYLLKESDTQGLLSILALYKGWMIWEENHFSISVLPTEVTRTGIENHVIVSQLVPRPFSTDLLVANGNEGEALGHG